MKLYLIPSLLLNISLEYHYFFNGDSFSRMYFLAKAKFQQSMVNLLVDIFLDLFLLSISDRNPNLDITNAHIPRLESVTSFSHFFKIITRLREPLVINQNSLVSWPTHIVLIVIFLPRISGYSKYYHKNVNLFCNNLIYLADSYI